MKKRTGIYNITYTLDSVLRAALGDFLLDNINDPRLRERAEITKLITLTGNDLTHDTAHDLKGALLNSYSMAKMK